MGNISGRWQNIIIVGKQSDVLGIKSSVCNEIDLLEDGWLTET